MVKDFFLKTAFIINMLISVMIFAMYAGSIRVYANGTELDKTKNSGDYIENYNMISDMDKVSDDLESIMKKYDHYQKENISFEEIYSLLISGKVDDTVTVVIKRICNNLTNDLLLNREIMGQLLLLIIVAAIFSNYSSILKFSYVGEQGFYISYLMSAALLMKSFTIIYDLAEDTVMYVKEMMECILPAFSMSLIMCSGITTSQITNSLFIWMLALTERLMLFVILPAVRVYFLIVILNQVNGKDRFSKLAALIKQLVEWILKILVAGVVGINVVKSTIAPVYDNVKYNTIIKGIDMLPGGGTMTGITGIFIATGVLIKNSVGIAGVIMLVIACGIPIIKIFIFYISFRIVLAVTQPISDARITSGIEAGANSAEILLRAVITSLALCILSIAIVILSTNVRLYSG